MLRNVVLLNIMGKILYESKRKAVFQFPNPIMAKKLHILVVLRHLNNVI